MWIFAVGTIDYLYSIKSSVKVLVYFLVLSPKNKQSISLRDLFLINDPSLLDEFSMLLRLRDYEKVSFLLSCLKIIEASINTVECTKDSLKLPLRSSAAYLNISIGFKFY